MKQMTEKQAWLAIAKAFEKYAKDGACVVEIRGKEVYVGSGICAVLNWLEILDCISTETYFTMAFKIRAEIARLRASGKKCPSGYLYPEGQKYANKRAALARKFAKQCK